MAELNLNLNLVAVLFFWGSVPVQEDGANN